MKMQIKLVVNYHCFLAVEKYVYKDSSNRLSSLPILSFALLFMLLYTAFFPLFLFAFMFVAALAILFGIVEFAVFVLIFYLFFSMFKTDGGTGVGTVFLSIYLPTKLKLDTEEFPTIPSFCLTIWNFFYCFSFDFDIYRSLPFSLSFYFSTSTICFSLILTYPLTLQFSCNIY